MDRKLTKQKLYAALQDVPNYSARIREELFSKKNISVSPGWVSQCLSPKSDKWNSDIIDAGLALVKSEREKEESLHDEANNL